MSDTRLDANRPGDGYPSKFWGWQDDQRAEVERRLAAGECDEWLLEQARRFDIPVWSGVEYRLDALSADDIAHVMAGRKTQARFALDPQPPAVFREGDVAGITNRRLWSISKMPGHHAWHPDPHPGIPCPFGLHGDRLWIAEAWCALAMIEGANAGNSCIQYLDGGEQYRDGAYYDPSNHDGQFRAAGKDWVGPEAMPRWASRVTLQITDVRLDGCRTSATARSRPKAACPARAKSRERISPRAGTSAMTLRRTCAGPPIRGCGCWNSRS